MNKNQLIEISEEDAMNFIWHRDKFSINTERDGYWYSPNDSTCYFKGIRIKGDLSICGKDLPCHIIIENSYINRIYTDNLNPLNTDHTLSVTKSKIKEISIRRTKFNGIRFFKIETEKVFI